MKNTYLDLSRPMTFPMIFAWIATSLSPWPCEREFWDILTLRCGPLPETDPAGPGRMVPSSRAATVTISTVQQSCGCLRVWSSKETGIERKGRRFDEPNLNGGWVKGIDEVIFLPWHNHRRNGQHGGTASREPLFARRLRVISIILPAGG